MNTSSLNLTQKIFLSIFFASCLLAIFFNNPLSGYTFEIPPLNPYANFDKQVPCNESQKLELRSAFEESRTAGVYDNEPKESTDKYINAMVAQCTRTVTYEAEAKGIPLPFSEWRSNSPIFNWFGSISNVLQFTLLSGLLSCFLCWLLMPKKTQDNEK